MHRRDSSEHSDSSVLRVLHVVVALDAGGMEGGIIKVARVLQGDGFDIHVVGLERRGTLAQEYPRPENVRTLEKRPGISLATVRRLWSLIREMKPDVLHTHNLGPLMYGVIASGFGRFCPIVHGEHCELVDAELSPKRMLQRRLCYRFCHTVHTVSEGQYGQLSELFPGQRVVAVVNGVDTGRFSPSDRRETRLALGIPTDCIAIGIVGSLVARKRHALLIRAVSRVQERFRNGVLLVVGDGPLRAELEEEAASSATPGSIRFLGYQRDPSLCYQAMDLLAAPSRAEGLSNVLLEAMACGVPVLAHRACGASEVITDGVDGWTSEIESVDALADLLTDILSSPKAMTAAGRMARQTVEKRFGVSKMAGEYARLYRAIHLP